MEQMSVIVVFGGRYPVTFPRAEEEHWRSFVHTARPKKTMMKRKE